MTPIKTFFLEPTGDVRLFLRRYSAGEVRCQDRTCHDAVTLLGEFPAIYLPDGHGRQILQERPELIPRDDERWPTRCAACDYAFLAGDAWQLHQEQLYRRLDNGEVHSLRKMPLGGMFYADWLLFEGSNLYRGPDGHSLCVMIPSSSGPHEWLVDSRCNNCKLPADDVHRCWIRHGDPRTGDVHVDKNGVTCSAGAGSIQTTGWHGYLDHGYLTE